MLFSKKLKQQFDKFLVKNYFIDKYIEYSNLRTPYLNIPKSMEAKEVKLILLRMLMSKRTIENFNNKDPKTGIVKFSSDSMRTFDNDAKKIDDLSYEKIEELHRYLYLSMYEIAVNQLKKSFKDIFKTYQ